MERLGLGSIKALKGERKGKARSFFSSPERLLGRAQGLMWGGKLGCVSMTTTQAQGQFHHLETKQDMIGYLPGSSGSPKHEPVCICVCACLEARVHGGMGDGEQNNPERN